MLVTREHGRELARRLRNAAVVLGSPNLLWVPPGHYYSPITSLRERRVATRSTLAEHHPSLPGVDLRTEAQIELLHELQAYYGDLPFGSSAGRYRYHYDNGFYNYSDAVFLATIMRHFKPKRFIEIGSGYSSALALDVNDLFLAGDCSLSFVEPYPRVLRRLVDDRDLQGRLLECRAQDVPAALFAELKANDILFIDSTHVARPGGDVNFLLFEVLPALATGVLVHIHDIRYPFEYPADWITKGIAWNEVYLLHAFLQFNRSFEIAIMNTYLEHTQPQWFEANMPLCLEDTGGSIWLRRV
jgi:hypothetical protein